MQPASSQPTAAPSTQQPAQPNPQAQQTKGTSAMEEATNKIETALQDFMKHFNQVIVAPANTEEKIRVVDAYFSKLEQLLDHSFFLHVLCFIF